MKTRKLSAAALSLAMGTTAVLFVGNAVADEIVVVGERTAPVAAPAPDADEVQIDIADYLEAISASLRSALGAESKTAPANDSAPAPVEVASVEGHTRG